MFITARLFPKQVLRAVPKVFPKVAVLDSRRVVLPAKADAAPRVLLSSSLESQWLGAHEFVRTVDVEQPPLVSSVVLQPQERVFLTVNGLYVPLGVVNHLGNNRFGAHRENHLGVERRPNLTAEILVATGLGGASEPELINGEGASQRPNESHPHATFPIRGMPGVAPAF